MKNKEDPKKRSPKKFWGTRQQKCRGAQIQDSPRSADTLATLLLKYYEVQDIVSNVCSENDPLCNPLLTHLTI